ncbi:AAA family ATPase [Nocardia testacea]|uniref:bifunctional aminoglycoside phosphotransferase/ATP-binding protein n=1 Tax=Nocardia testacea TaxID=248551 RepID=UPI003A8A9E6F
MTVGRTLVQLRETHTGVVVLCGDRAYKTKKPITTDFLDFGTTELRERACAREVELNRRLAPDIYLGVAHLTDPTGGPEEPVIVMRRLPEESRLSNRLEGRSGGSPDLSGLVESLVAFHATARRGPDIDRAGTVEALAERWNDLVASMRHQWGDVLDPEVLDMIRTLARRYLFGRRPLLETRVAGGRIVDGHGDLLAEDIFELSDGFRILDCLDFDDRLRYVDCLDDIAFLAMDLEFLGHPEHAENLVREYRRRSGDTAPESLVDHYIAYRALVRAKVDAIRAGQGDATAGDRARRHLRIAVGHLRRSAVRLVLVGGLPGSGKSTVAAGLVARTGAVVLSSDGMRRELRSTGDIAGESGVYDRGAYSPVNRDRVYTELVRRAQTLLSAGVSVVLDASWLDAGRRKVAETAASAAGACIGSIRCVCPAAVALDRIRHRGNSLSEATPPIATALADTVDPWPDAVDIDTDAPRVLSVSAACRVWDDLAGEERAAAPINGAAARAATVSRDPSP